MNDHRPTADVLLRLLGPACLIRLAETRGGIRLYVPGASERSGLAAEIGDVAADLLISRFGGESIPVPLVHDLRARHYRASGDSNSQIALKLGMTERGVERLFARMDSPPAKGSGDPRQLKLFG